jgi:hypothetical protein
MNREDLEVINSYLESPICGDEFTRDDLLAEFQQVSLIDINAQMLKPEALERLRRNGGRGVICLFTKTTRTLIE